MNVQSPPGFPTRLRKLRKQHGYTQAALAESKDRVFHMERSVFWRMRELWQSARAALRPGSPHDQRER